MTLYRRLLQVVHDALFPPRCVVCRQSGVWLCAVCIARIKPIENPCRRCALPMRAIPRSAIYVEGIRSPTFPPAPARSGTVRNISTPIQQFASRELTGPESGAWACACHGLTRVARATAVGVYSEPLDRAIRALKYGRVQPLAPILGALAASQWRRAVDRHSEPGGAFELVVAPVPSHASRTRQRGIDHAGVLAQHVAAVLHAPFAPILIRQRVTDPQAGKDVAARENNVRRAFAIDPRWTSSRCVGSLAGRAILLVDDVMTTGATVEACAATLLDGGAAVVNLCLVARAVRRSPFV